MLPEINGFAIPAVDLELDWFTDHPMDDPDEGPPEDWPSWVDSERWELDLGDDFEELDVSLSPQDEPLAPDDEFPARARDLEDAHRHTEWLELMELEHKFTDQDLIAAGGIPG